MVVLIPVVFMLGILIGFFVRQNRAAPKKDAYFLMQMWERRGCIVNKYNMREGK